MKGFSLIVRDGLRELNHLLVAIWQVRVHERYTDVHRQHGHPLALIWDLQPTYIGVISYNPFAKYHGHPSTVCKKSPTKTNPRRCQVEIVPHFGRPKLETEKKIGKMSTLWYTNIAMENPPCWWYLPGNTRFSWVMLVSGRVTLFFAFEEDQKQKFVPKGQ